MKKLTLREMLLLARKRRGQCLSTLYVNSTTSHGMAVRSWPSMVGGSLERTVFVWSFPCGLTIARLITNSIKGYR